MSVTVRPYTEKDLPAMTQIWNAVVEDGMAFPQTDPLSPQAAAGFFAGQSLSAVAQGPDGAILGLYILHPQ